MDVDDALREIMKQLHVRTRSEANPDNEDPAANESDEDNNEIKEGGSTGGTLNDRQGATVIRSLVRRSEVITLHKNFTYTMQFRRHMKWKVVQNPTIHDALPDYNPTRRVRFGSHDTIRVNCRTMVEGSTASRALEKLRKNAASLERRRRSAAAILAHRLAAWSGTRGVESEVVDASSVLPQHLGSSPSEMSDIRD